MRTNQLQRVERIRFIRFGSPKSQPTLFASTASGCNLVFEIQTNAPLKASDDAESISVFHAWVVSQERQQIDYRFEKNDAGGELMEIEGGNNLIYKGNVK